MTKQAARISCSQCPQQLHGGFGRAPGRYQIVHQDDALALRNAVAVHLHLIDAVFQGVGDTHGGMRELAFLADRHESRGQAMRHGTAENEAARLDAGDPVYPCFGPGPDQLIDDDRGTPARCPAAS